MAASAKACQAWPCRSAPFSDPSRSVRYPRAAQGRDVQGNGGGNLHFRTKLFPLSFLHCHQAMIKSSCEVITSHFQGTLTPT